MKFKIGDRVQFTAEALKTADPAIADEELRGIVMQIESGGNGRLLIEFDDGTSEWRHKSELEAEVQ